MTVDLYTGDCRSVLAALPACSVHCVITSPPYFGLRDYGVDGQLGLEPTPGEYVANLVAVFRAIRRVWRDDGVAWLNLGDSYARSGGAYGRGSADGEVRRIGGERRPACGVSTASAKQLLGTPWRVAFALQDDGWYLRSDVIWQKPNVMPESVRDRPTRSHEYVFLLTKSTRYYYDADAVAEEATSSRKRGPALHPDAVSTHGNGGLARREPQATRNRRTVWTIQTQGYKEAHFAAFPPALVEPMILAGTSEAGCCTACGAPWRRQIERTPMVIRHGPKAGGYGSRTTDGFSGTMLSPATRVTVGWAPSCACSASAQPCTVLDPFAGSGTTLAVAAQHSRHAIGVELNADYIALAQRRVHEAAPKTPIRLKDFAEPIDNVS